MRAQRRSKSAYIAIIAFVLFILSIVTSNFGVPAVYSYAAGDVVSAYENQNVLEDLEGAAIGGEPFKPENYPYKKGGTPQVISFVEYCYSANTEKQSDFGLYIYVYNPQDISFDTATERNKIQFTYDSGEGYSKYELKFLNYSNTAGYEGRFYKFKIILTDLQREKILKTVAQNMRIYKISGIELSYKSVVTEYECGQEYIYSGFAKGYGSELASNDTLSCTVNGLDLYLSLNVKSTYWRPQGTHSDGYTKDTLHSVYFSVPNDLIEEYGEMTAVHATWLNAYTAPIFVTGNQKIYNALYPYIGQYISGGMKFVSNDNPDHLSPIEYALIATEIPPSYQDAEHSGYYAYNLYWDNVQEYYSDPKPASPPSSTDYESVLYYLRYLFYADGGDADKYNLSAEALIGDKESGVKGWFEKYTEEHGGSLVNNRYSRDLFDRVDEKFTDVNIKSTDEYKLTDNVVSTSLWDRFWGTTLKGEHTYTLSAIQKVTGKDINRLSNKSLFCNTYYVAESDYDDFTNYVTKSEEKGETVYLFRYYQSEFVSHEVGEYSRWYDTAWPWQKYDKIGWYRLIDSNAYFAQEWVQLDFDIIDLTFTRDDVETVIPVVMSPIDIAADVEHPAHTTPESKKFSWWKTILILLCVILGIILLLPILPYIVRLVIWILTAPIRAIGEGISERRRERKRKKQREKQEEEARIRAEKRKK